MSNFMFNKIEKLGNSNNPMKDLIEQQIRSLNQFKGFIDDFLEANSRKEAGEELSRTKAKGGLVPHFMAASFYPSTLKNSFTGLVNNGVLPPASQVSDPNYKPTAEINVVNGLLTNDAKLQLEAIKNQFNVKIENLRNPNKGSTIGLILKIVVFLIVAYLFYIYVIKKKKV